MNHNAGVPVAVPVTVNVLYGEDPYEPNDTLDEAAPVSYYVFINATISTVGDEDYFLLPEYASGRVVGKVYETPLEPAIVWRKEE